MSSSQKGEPSSYLSSLPLSKQPQHRLHLSTPPLNLTNPSLDNSNQAAFSFTKICAQGLGTAPPSSIVPAAVYNSPGSESYTRLKFDPHHGQIPRVAQWLDLRSTGSSLVQVISFAEKSTQVWYGPPECFRQGVQWQFVSVLGAWLAV
jgi:hypothetical protein